MRANILYFAGENGRSAKKTSFVHAYPKSMFSQPVGDSK
jgi:hypothetical protein